MTNSHKENDIKVVDKMVDDAGRFEDRLFEFLELSQKIRTIISHENAILETCGCLSLEAYLAQKTALLQAYERNAENLCMDITMSRNTDKVAQSLLIEEIVSVKETLTDNTVRQFQSLEKSISEAQGDKSWH